MDIENLKSGGIKIREKLASTLTIIILLIFIDYIFFNIKVQFFSISTENYLKFVIILNFILNSILIFLFIENIIYKQFYNLKSNKIKISIFILIPLIISIIISDRLRSIDRGYFINKRIIAKYNNVYKYDELLGWSSIPNSTGTMETRMGDSVFIRKPVIFDSIGCRTVPDSLKIKSNTVDLYLGCSFTFGDKLEAQNTYPYLTSKLLKHDYINAGGLSYGLGQMMVQLEKIIKKHKYKYVFIQLSPWLVERTMELTAPTWYYYRPCPYFSDEGKGFKLNPTAFPVSCKVKKYWYMTRTSYYDRMEFYFTDGLKMEVYQYYYLKFEKFKMFLGLKSKPTKRYDELERYFYEKAIDICNKNNAIPIIVKICYPWYSADTKDNLIKYLKGKVKIIDLDKDLHQKVIETGIRYDRLFYVQYAKRNRIIIYDTHPNEYANKLFSERIYNGLKN